MDRQCVWASGPDRSEHSELIQTVLKFLVDEAVFQSTDRRTKVVEWNSPEELKSRLDLRLRDEGTTNHQLLEVVKQVVRFSVKTGHPYFINQLFSSLDIYGLIGQWVTDALNPSVYTYEVAPVFTLMEIEVLRCMGDYVGYEEHDGLFSPGGSISNMYGMLLARHFAFPHAKKTGTSCLGRLVVLTSVDAHYSLAKAAFTLGLGSDNLVLVKVDHRGRMDVNDLKDHIKKIRTDGAKPIMVCATAGTTVLGAYDPINAIADVCSKEGIWLHVDAAWGGGALVSKTHRHKLNGVNRADSVTWNPHKLLASPQQCSVFLTKHVGLLQQCNSASAAYLFQKDKFYDTSYDTGDKHLQCGRRADVMKFWCMWKAKGSKGLEKHVDHIFATSQKFVEKIKTRKGFSLLTEPECTNVCFHYVPPSLRAAAAAGDEGWRKKVGEVAPKIKERMVKEGRMMITYQPLRQHPNFFRLVLQNSQVGEKDIDYFINTIEELAADL